MPKFVHALRNAHDQLDETDDVDRVRDPPAEVANLKIGTQDGAVG